MAGRPYPDIYQYDMILTTDGLGGVGRCPALDAPALPRLEGVAGPGFLSTGLFLLFDRGWSVRDDTLTSH